LKGSVYHTSLRGSHLSGFVDVAGIGITPVAITLSPPSNVLVETAVGQSTAPITITLSSPSTSTDNTGTITVGLTGTDAADFSIATNGRTAALVPGASCPIAVMFTPRARSTRTAPRKITATQGGTASAL
jgi:hypothetical protein